MMKTKKLRDKERTRKSLLKAVGKILRKEGYNSLRINNVARVAGVNKKLIYDNFGGIDGLISAYLASVDVWIKENDSIQESTLELPLNSAAFAAVHQTAFKKLEESEEMQKIILWGISEKNKNLREITDQREIWGNKLLEKVADRFKNSGIDFNAVNAILVSSIYYLVLHAKTNGSTMCGVDAASQKGKKRIFDSIKFIMDACFEKAK